MKPVGFWTSNTILQHQMGKTRSTVGAGFDAPVVAATVSLKRWDHGPNISADLVVEVCQLDFLRHLIE